MGSLWRILKTLDKVRHVPLGKDLELGLPGPIVTTRSCES